MVAPGGPGVPVAAAGQASVGGPVTGRERWCDF